MTIENFGDDHRWRWRIWARDDDRELAGSSDAYGQWMDWVHAIKALKVGVAGAAVYDMSQSPPAVA